MIQSRSLLFVYHPAPIAGSERNFFATIVLTFTIFIRNVGGNPFLTTSVALTAPPRSSRMLDKQIWPVQAHH